MISPDIDGQQVDERARRNELHPKTVAEVTTDLNSFARSMSDSMGLWAGAGNIGHWIDYGYFSDDSHFSLALKALEDNFHREPWKCAETFGKLGVEALRNVGDINDPDSTFQKDIAIRALGALETILTTPRLYNSNPTTGETVAGEMALTAQQDILARIGEIQFIGHSQQVPLNEIRDALFVQERELLSQLKTVGQNYHAIITDANEQSIYPFQDLPTLIKRYPWLAGVESHTPELAPIVTERGYVGSHGNMQDVEGVFTHASPLHKVLEVPMAPQEQGFRRYQVGPLTELGIGVETIPQVSGVEKVPNGSSYERQLSNLHRQALENPQSGYYGNFSSILALEFAINHLSPKDQNQNSHYENLKEGLVSAIMTYAKASLAVNKIESRIECNHEQSPNMGLKAQKDRAKEEAVDAWKNTPILKKFQYGKIENHPSHKKYVAIQKELDDTTAELQVAQSDLTKSYDAYVGAQKAIALFVNDTSLFNPEEVAKLTPLYHKMEQVYSFTRQRESEIIDKLKANQKAVLLLDQFESKELSPTLAVRVDEETKQSKVSSFDVLTAAAYCEQKTIFPERSKIKDRILHICNYIAEATKDLQETYDYWQKKPDDIDRQETFKKAAKPVVEARRKFLSDASVNGTYLERYNALEDASKVMMETAEALNPRPGFVLGESRFGDAVLRAG